MSRQGGTAGFETGIRETKSKSNRVVEGIMNNVMNRVWPAGTRLPGENDLAEMFGVSRVSVRDAISQLMGRGILRAVQGDGTYVNDTLPGDYLKNALQMIVIEKTDYREIQEFRLLLEPGIAAEAAKKITEEGIEEVRLCIESQEKAQEAQDLEVYLKEDMHFHNILAHISESNIVINVMDLLQDLLWLGMSQSGAKTGFHNGIRFHREILECLMAHDVEGARATMWCHINDNLLFIRKTEETEV